MNETYVATFHTHLAAMMSARTLKRQGIVGILMPVPRSLSSSCGTCVRYEAQLPCLEAMDTDVDGVYHSQDGGYTLVWKNQD